MGCLQCLHPLPCRSKVGELRASVRNCKAGVTDFAVLLLSIEWVRACRCSPLRQIPGDAWDVAPAERCRAAPLSSIESQLAELVQD